MPSFSYLRNQEVLINQLIYSLQTAVELFYNLFISSGRTHINLLHLPCFNKFEI